MDTTLHDILILGAGAAGLTCALAASGGLSPRTEPSPRSIIILEGNPIPGKKMRLAGGGMGNVTNRTLSPDCYVGGHPEFVHHALRKFPTRAALGLLDAFGFPYEEREHGQIFGLKPIGRLVDAMAEACIGRGVGIRTRHRIVAIERDDDIFAVICRTDGGEARISARRVVIALGSPAFPHAGATDAAARLARSLGHACVPFRPVLSPLVLPEGHPLLGLQGVSIDVGIQAGPRPIVRPLLFTHKGFSGPAGLIASCFWQGRNPLLVDMLPDGDLPDAPERLTATGLLRRRFPQRLADALLRLVLAARPELPTNRPLAEWGRAHREALHRTLRHCDLTPTRTEGMVPAEAAAGGLDTDAFDPRTMESHLVPNMYAIGECLDIAGILGGYNLHFAFASGFLAGKAMA